MTESSDLIDSLYEERESKCARFVLMMLDDALKATNEGNELEAWYTLGRLHQEMFTILGIHSEAREHQKQNE